MKCYKRKPKERRKTHSWHSFDNRLRKRFSQVRSERLKVEKEMLQQETPKGN
jgi:hypothetical protein